MGCDRITYPHITWVLDDGRREDVRELAERFGARYLTRPTNEHAKAGNINNALAYTQRTSCLLILDADHVPQPDILDATIGYFDNPSVAVVQTPHDFGNHDSFQHFETGRHDQSMFFEMIMPGKDRHNGAFWCGSAALILRQALEGIGGIATETIAEDFHTTITAARTGMALPLSRRDAGPGSCPPRPGLVPPAARPVGAGQPGRAAHSGEPGHGAPGLTLKQRASYLSSLLAYFVPLQRLGHAGRAGGHADQRPASTPRHPVAVRAVLAAVDGPRTWRRRRCSAGGGPRCGTVPTPRS